MTRTHVLVDPVCSSTRGHNLPLLIQYRQWLEQHTGAVVEVHVTDALPEAAAAKAGVCRSLPFLYGDNHQLMKNLRLRRSTGLPPTQAGLRAALATLFGHRLDEVQVILPYADYHGVLALRDLVCAAPDPGSVRAALRFIGVMENAGPGAQPLKAVTQAVRDMRRGGVRLTLAAEAARYAALLSDVLDEPVDVLPPLLPVWGIGERHLGTSAPFAYCPGTGREDKGFAVLPELARRYRAEFVGSPLRFVCQQPTPSLDAVLHQTCIRLNALPNVDLMPSMLDLEGMIALYRQAAVVLLPYDVGTYRLRSSASLADAFATGAPVVTLRDTGLAAFVDYYGNGIVAEDLDEVVAACGELAADTAGAWNRRAEAARWRYLQDSTSAWLRWLADDVVAA